jgi:hypothetical protein
MKIWRSVLAIVFGIFAVPAGLIMQAMAWNCENEPVRALRGSETVATGIRASHADARRSPVGRR